MKTAISIPDDLYEEAERLCRRMGVSRSEFYAQAVRRYVIERDEGRIREQLQEFHGGRGYDNSLHPDLEAMQSEGLPADDWSDIAPRVQRKKAG